MASSFLRRTIIAAGSKFGWATDGAFVIPARGLIAFAVAISADVPAAAQVARGGLASERALGKLGDHWLPLLKCYNIDVLPKLCDLLRIPDDIAWLECRAEIVANINARAPLAAFVADAEGRLAENLPRVHEANNNANANYSKQ